MKKRDSMQMVEAPRAPQGRVGGLPRNPRPRRRPRPARPMLPPAFAAFKIEGGAETLGHVVRLVVLAPEVIFTVGDLTIARLDAGGARLLIAPEMLDELIAVMPKHAAHEPETDPELLPRLVDAFKGDVVEFREYLYERARAGYDYRPPGACDMFVEALVRVAVQDLRLPPALVARAFADAWRSSLLIVGDGGREYARNHALASAPPRVDVAQLVARIAGEQEWLYTGASHARIRAELEADRQRAEAARVLEQEQEARKTRTVTGTARELGVIAVRVFGGHKVETLAYARVWPKDLPVPHAIAHAANYGGAPGITYELLGDEDAITVNEAALDLGRRTVPPRAVLDAICAAARATVAAREPVTSPIDMRQPAEYRRRTRMYRAELAALAEHIYTRPDSYAAPVVRMIALALGAVRLGLDSRICAEELHRAAREAGAQPWASMLELVRDASALAADPARHMFARLEDAP